jgi:uncharacterized protein
MEDSSANYLDGSILCLSCGICCQGILFDHTRYPDPMPFAISPEPRDPLLPLACRLFSFSQNSCRVYKDPNRPRVCREHQCHLLKQLLQNKLTLDQAQSKINKIKTLITKILVQIPQSDSPMPVYLLIQRVSDELQLELDSGDRSHLELFLDINWLRLLI